MGFEFKVTKDTNFKGLQDLAKRIRSGTDGVLVGLPKGPVEEDGVTVAQVGAWNEFGSGSGARLDGDTRRRLAGIRKDSPGLPGGPSGSGSLGTPERPWLRPAIRKNLDVFRALNIKSLRGMCSGAITMDVALARLGELGARKAKEEITNGTFAPNAPSTIAAKGSDKPLIDDGQMRQSVTYVVDKGAANLRASGEIAR